MKEKRAIFISTVSQIIVRFFTLAFTLVAVKLITNHLGPAGTGNYNTISTYLNFFIVIADLGLFSVTVREISKKPEDEKKILSNVLVIRAVTALLAVLVSILVVFLTNFNHDVKIGTLIASGFLFFNLLSSVYDMILQHRLKMQFSAGAEFIARIITLIALFAIIRLNLGFYFIVSTITLSGILIYILKRYFASKFVAFSPKYNKEVSNWIFTLSWPLGIVFVVNNLFFKIDTLMVAAIKGPVAVGIYSTAYKVLEVIVFVGGYFASSLKPILSREITNNKKNVANIITKSINIMLILALPITIVCVVFPKEIIEFISSKDFLSGSNALILLAFTLPFIYLDNLLGEILLANNERKLLTKIAVSLLAFNFLTNLYFIPKYSFMGAAVTTLASEILLFIINYYFTKKIIPYRLDRSGLFKIFLTSIITFVLALFVRRLEINFLVSIFSLLAIYLGICFAFRIISPSFIKEFKKEEADA